MLLVGILVLWWCCVFGCAEEVIIQATRSSSTIIAAPSLRPSRFWKSNNRSNSFLSHKSLLSTGSLIRNATHSTYYTTLLYNTSSSSSSMSTTIPSIGACSLGTGSVEKSLSCTKNNKYDITTKVILTTATTTEQQRAAAAWKARTDTSITATSEEDDTATAAATAVVLQVPTTTTPTTTASNNRYRHALLGGEPCLLDEDTELERVEEMLQILTLEEQQSMPDIAMPIRHLRAEKGNVYKAIEKLRNALQWRQDFQVDSLLTSCSSSSMSNDADSEKRIQYRNIMIQEADTGKIYIRGYTHDGRAIMYMRPGRENTNNENNNIKHLVWNLEKAIACTKKQSLEIINVNHNDNNRIIQPKEKVVLLIDYTNFKLSNAPPLSTSRLTLDILQKHYPERMQCAYLLHTPFFFNAFWSIIKPFIDPITKEKIIFCNTRQGLQKLYNHVGSDNMNQLEDSIPGGSIPTTIPTTFDTQTYLTMPFDESL